MKKIGRTVRRRRREGKTDYKARFGMLKSEKPRVIFRKTNKHIFAQIVVSDIAQDKVVVSVNSKDLIANGWPENLKGSLKSLQASYLTGYLLGKKSKEIRSGIIDMGLYRNTSNSKAHAFIKGLVDSGFEIPHKEENLMTDSLLEKNEKTGKLVSQLKEKING